MAGVRAQDSNREAIEIGSRAEAIRYAINAAQTGDCVIILGKGHETGQDINGVVSHFDDREEATAAIVERGV
jgi:UDP-N-acetylmuramoyl-L-alanyl-D-glutamate--2,6-diaminopimelate ligase